MEAVGQLTGGVAHDFNNLLTVVLGNLQLLERKLNDDPESAKLAATAIRATRRGGELTHRLLAFARRQSLEPKSVDLNQLVRESEGLLSSTMGETVTVEVETGAAEELWMTRVDPAQMQNALLNLAINASQAMPDGGTLTVSIENRSISARGAEQFEDFAPGDYVAMTISDSGSGMRGEVAARAFDPFFTTKQVGEGSGLGLSMVYGFAKQTGGTALIDSVIGRGTAITLLLPRAEPEERHLEDVPAPAGDASGETVLVVEDDEDVRQIAVGLLHDRGYQVVEASNGHEALRILQERPRFDVLCTDIVMPGGMSGMGLASAARDLHPSLRVLMTSGDAKGDPSDDFKLETGFAFLAKPYSGEQLSITLRTLVEQGRIDQ